MCNAVMKSTVKHGQGLSTNAKACYDKLGEEVVAPLWFDECAQSASLRFFFLHLAWNSVNSLKKEKRKKKTGPAEQLTPSD